MDAPDLSRRKAVTRMPRRFCRHCHIRVRCRPRNLCWTCYYTPEVLDLYPPILPADSNRKHPQAACELCGCWVQRACRRCSTCKLPEPFRGLMVAALAEFERRAAEELPMFDAIRESGVVY